jgi:hypothetical protein
MSLYKRFRGTTEPRGTIKESGTTINHNTNFYFRTEAAMLRFYQNDHQPPKKGMLSTQKEV